MHPPENDLALAHRLADRAESVILPHFRRLPGVDDKGGGRAFDPVTVADREAEAAMRALLAAERPDDGVFGEEFANRAGSSGRTWILDPIDGTRGFLMGLPTWGVLVALADASGPVLGLMAQPFVGERFFAGPGGAAWRGAAGERRLATRPAPRLDTALLATTSPHAFSAAVAPGFARLAAAVRMVRYGTDCYAYAMLAAGQIDVVVEEGLHAFDIAPFVVIVERAGGLVTDFAGHRVGPTLPDRYGGEAVAVGDPALLPQVLDALNG